MGIVEHLRNNAVANRTLLSMAKGNFRRARSRGEAGIRWLTMAAWYQAKVVLFPWNWVGGVA